MSRIVSIEFKRLALRPYPGEILCFRDYEFFKVKYYSLTGEICPHPKRTGRYIRIDQKDKDPTWLVYGRRPDVLAHEFSHVLFRTFEDVGINPMESNQEPFCYMLSQLMQEAR